MTDRPSVAFYMHDLSGGGVERMRLALIAELRSRGLDVTLVVGVQSGPLRALIPDDLNVVPLDRPGTLAAIRPLARFLRTARPDVLVSSLDHNNVTALLARKLARVPTRVVICQHNALSAERVLGWRYRAIPWLYRLLQRQAAGIVAVSEGVADDLAATARIPRARITSIYNPIVGADFAARAQGPAPHPWLQNKTVPVFVFAGRLTPQKNPALAIDGLALLLRDYPTRLLFLGEGPLLPELQARVRALSLQDHVAFVGFQANPLPWIRCADALLCPSRYEGLGNVIVEALACGTPVIATDCPHGPSEILLGGQVGRLVPVDDPTCLAAAMLGQLHAQRDAGALKRRAEAFTAERCADAHQALFRTILVAGRPGRQVLGMQLSELGAPDVLERVTRRPEVSGVGLVVTPNLDHVRLLRRAEFAQAYRSAALVCADGVPVLLYARMRGLRLPGVVTGCELFHRLAHHPSLPTQELFFVLECPATAQAVLAWSDARGLRDRVTVSVAPPGLSGDELAQARLAREIGQAGPTILVITLGAPTSEVFVHRHRHALPTCWALCVGQAVRVELGLVERAPSTWRRIGLEWAWRIRQEPRRLIRRYAESAAWFPVAIVRDLVSRRPLPIGHTAG